MFRGGGRVCLEVLWVCLMDWTGTMSVEVYFMMMRLMYNSR